MLIGMQAVEPLSVHQFVRIKLRPSAEAARLGLGKVQAITDRYPSRLACPLPNVD